MGDTGEAVGVVRGFRMGRAGSLVGAVVARRDVCRRGCVRCGGAGGCGWVAGGAARSVTVDGGSGGDVSQISGW